MVTIYTTETCPKCQILKKKMEAKNIEFVDVMDMDTLVELGFTAVPWLSVDGELMDFGEANVWINEQE